MNTSTRWLQFGTSIFTTMTQAALQAGAVNLAQGFPDFDGPDAIKEAAIAAIREGKNQYAPAAGLPELRQLLARRQKNRTGLDYDPDTEVTVVSGATEGLFVSLLGFLSEGDELVTFEPFYDSYPVGVFAAGARLKAVELEAPHWTFSEASLRAALSPATKAILVNTPHNPTGKVFSGEELTMIAKVAQERDLLVITDEVYEELVYAPATHVSLATLPGMRERTVVISSTSKTFSMTGWKVGYVFAPKALTDVLRAVHQFTVFCSATPLQQGMIAALRLGDGYFQEFRREYDERRQLLQAILARVGFKSTLSQGSYFILADYTALSDKLDTDFALWLTQEAKVACIPTSVFYSHPAAIQAKQRYVRFGFCKNAPTLKAAEANLLKFFKR